MSRARLACVAGAVVVLLSGCIAPAVNRGAFAQNAKSALESASSETSTAQIALGTLLSGNATKAYTDTVVTDSENAMGGIQTSFGVVDPPSPDQDTLRDQTLTVLGDADDALAHARIAVRRGGPSALNAARKELQDATTGLESALEKLQ